MKRIQLTCVVEWNVCGAKDSPVDIVVNRIPLDIICDQIDHLSCSKMDHR